MGEHGSVIRFVRRRVLNDFNKITDGVLLVIINDEEDLGDFLTEFHKM